MNPRWPLFAAGACLAFSISAFLPAQEQEAAAPQAPADAAPAATAEQYPELLQQWKDIKAQADKLIEQYQAAPETGKEPIRRQFDDLAAKADRLVPQLRDAAEAKFRAGDRDAELVEVLAGMAREEIRNDRYESALRLANLLLESKAEAKGMHNVAGQAAFSLNQFDRARRHLEQAMRDGEIDRRSRLDLGSLDDVKRRWSREDKLRSQEAVTDDLPLALLETTEGDITLELFEDHAPNTVANFIQLVESGFYDGLAFHRVLPGFMAQGGDPKGDGTDGPGYNIACECYRDDARHHFRGSLSMAHAGRDTGGSQFFLTFRPTPNLDGRHTVFGRVVEGFDVLAQLNRRDPSQARQPEPSRIEKAKVLRKRDHDYAVKKINEEKAPSESESRDGGTP